MDIKMDFFRSFRAYIFDFGGGLIWMVAMVMLLAAFVPLPGLTEILDYISQIESSKSLRILLITGSIILPFVVNLALKPISLFVMNIGLLLQRLVVEVLLKLVKIMPIAKMTKFFSSYIDVLKARLSEPKLVELQQKAHAQLVEHLGFGVKPSAPDGKGLNNSFSQETVLLFVKKMNPALASSLDRSKEDVWFRSSLLVPTAVIVAAVVQHVTQSNLWSIAAGLVSFIIAFVSAARAWRAWHEQLNAAVLILFRN
jgi:hypothetical protein